MWHLILVNVLIGISLIGLYCNWNNFLLMLLSIELLMISIVLLFILFSFLLDDIINQLYSILVLTVAASETVIGLSLLINFINLKQNIQITDID